MVADGLYFPNGVALTPDESALMLVETTTHRLLRVELPGGTVRVLADLPAYPDNLSAVGDGTYWIALPSPRVPIAERLLPHPRLRQLAALLPDAMQPQPRRYGLVALVDGDGHGPPDAARPGRAVLDDHRGAPARRPALAGQPDRPGRGPGDAGLSPPRAPGPAHRCGGPAPAARLSRR